MARIKEWSDEALATLTHRVRGGLRFALCLIAVDVVTLWWFGSGSASLFSAYGVVALLYFCDFDGSLSERAISFSMAGIVGLAGVVIGVLISASLIGSLALVGSLALLLALTRALLGNVAQGAIGAQLGVLLAVMTPATPGRLGTCVAAWCLGAGSAALVGIFIFPKHNARKASAALADWMEHAAQYAEALGRGAGILSTHDALTASAGRLDLAMAAVGNRPTWDTRRTRLIAEMMSEALAATATFSPQSDTAPTAALDTDLSRSTAASLRWCAAILTGRDTPSEGIGPLAPLRDRDLDATVSWLRAASTDTAADRIAVVRAHHPLRVLSVEALALRHRVEHLNGDKAISDELGFPMVRSGPQLLIASVSLRSLWLRHGIQAAVGMTAAVLVARLMGVDHAFWVAMSTLGLLNASYSPNASRRGAVLAGAGTVIGAALGAVILAFHPPLVVIGILTALVAYSMLQMASLASMASQAAFTCFALLNTTFLGWPTRSHVVEYRLLDVAMGLAIGIGAMTLVFPGGASKIVATSTAALRERLSALASVTQRFVTGSESKDAVTATQTQVADELARLGSALRVLSTGELAPKRLGRLRAVRQEGEAALVASSLAISLCEGSTAPRRVPELSQALRATPGTVAETVAKSLTDNPGVLSSAAPQAVRGLWTGAWLDAMAHASIAVAD